MTQLRDRKTNPMGASSDHIGVPAGPPGKPYVPGSSRGAWLVRLSSDHELASLARIALSLAMADLCLAQAFGSTGGSIR